VANFTTTTLIDRVKRNAAIPETQPAFSDQRLIDMLDDEMVSIVVPLLLTYQEEYYVTSKDFVIDGIKSEFIIPRRAVGSKLREVKLVDKNKPDVDQINLPRISLSDIERHDFGFYLRRNFLVLLQPEVHKSVDLRLYFFNRPGKLVKESLTAKITIIDTTNKIITMSAVPSTWTTATLLDMVQGASPFSVLGIDITISAITSTTVTVSSIPTDLVVGDYLSETEESSIPNLPQEMHLLLCQGVIVKVLEALGDQNGLQMALKKYEEIKESINTLLSPRVVGELKKIHNRDDLLYAGRSIVV